MPKGLKPVKRTLATGQVVTYWYHRATGKRLKNDPETAAGHVEIATLDKRAKVVEAKINAAVGTYARLWEDYRKSPEWRRLKPRTRSDYQAVRDWLGADADRLLSDLTPGGVYKLRDKGEKQKGRRFGNYVVQVLRLTLEWARKREMIPNNPAKEVEALRKPVGARNVNRAWSLAEVSAFAAAAPPQVAVAFSLGLFAGMRQGDALRVTWSAYNGHMLTWIAGKNGEECFAPVSGEFKRLLDDAKARRGTTVQIAVTSTGTAWTESGFRASFFKLIRKLVAEGKMQPGCTYHGLRHTIVTGARNDGESDYRAAAAIGDRSSSQAEIYGRDADRQGAQTAILGAHQKRYENVDWKTATTDWKTRRVEKPRKPL